MTDPKIISSPDCEHIFQSNIDCSMKLINGVWEINIEDCLADQNVDVFCNLNNNDNLVLVILLIEEIQKQGPCVLTLTVPNYVDNYVHTFDMLYEVDELTLMDSDHICTRFKEIIKSDVALLSDLEFIEPSIRLKLIRNKIHPMKLNYDVTGEHCVIVREYFDPEIIKIAKLMKGAKKITLMLVHPNLIPDDINRINQSKIDEVYVTDAVVHDKLSSKFKIIRLNEIL